MVVPILQYVGNVAMFIFSVSSELTFSIFILTKHIEKKGVHQIFLENTTYV